jgi:hypothetical protein
MDADVVSRVTRLLARPECADRLEIALLGRRHMAGDPAAAEELEHRHAEALAQGAGGCQLRLATMAEAYTRLPGGVPVAAQLIATALAAPLGDAAMGDAAMGDAAMGDAAMGDAAMGDAAMAGLTLAESVSIVAPCDTESIRLALDAAEAAAHAVADPVLRARTIARVTAMVQHWWPSPPDPDEAIAALLRAGPSAGSPWTGGPSAGGPSAGGPSAGGPSAGGPSAGGPSAGGPSAGAPSTGGNDPGLRPLIAARLSAAVVVDLGPPGPRLAGRLRRLVPVAAADPAAHCTVLTRLLLATPAEDVRLLEKIPTAGRHDRGPR